jgi:hypothetical protein
MAPSRKTVTVEAISNTSSRRCFSPCVSFHLFRSMGFARERNRPPPRPRPGFRSAPGLSRKGVRRFGDRTKPPFVLFICQDDAQRDDFLARADHELTGHRWHPSRPSDEHEYIGRRHILFCDERDIHLRRPQARRLPPYPPKHPARRGSGAEIRGVRLPGRLHPTAVPEPACYAEDARNAAAAG